MRPVHEVPERQGAAQPADLEIILECPAVPIEHPGQKLQGSHLCQGVVNVIERVHEDVQLAHPPSASLQNVDSAVVLVRKILFFQ